MRVKKQNKKKLTNSWLLNVLHIIHVNIVCKKFTELVKMVRNLVSTIKMNGRAVLYCEVQLKFINYLLTSSTQ